MSWPAALALAIGLALFAAAVVIGLAKTRPRTPDKHHVAPLRAFDAADHMVPNQPGDDDQFGRWHLPHIRRMRDDERAAETQATHGEPS